MPKNFPAAYQATKGSILDINKEFYNNLTELKTTRKLIDSVIVPIRDAKAWIVPAGNVFRIKIINGPQVGDFNMWSLNNPREKMWASRTRQLQRAHVSTYDRLWSNLPYLRQMATIIDDTLADYGVDEYGGRIHDLLGTRCDPYVNRLLTGEDFDYHCHSNLTRAIIPYGLTEFDVHDVLNVFQCTGLNQNDQYFMKASPAKVGDYLEFFAEIDLLCAMSCCPGGDLSIDLWGPEARDPLETCHPLGVEIYEVDKELLKDWSSPRPAYEYYRGQHGLTKKDVNWEEIQKTCNPTK